MIDFKHPLAVSAYVVLALALLFFLGNQTRVFSEASPSQCLHDSIATAKAIRASPRNVNDSLKLAELARAFGLVQAAGMVADNATVARVTGTDLPKLQQSLRNAALEIGTKKLGLQRDEVLSVLS